ncbi:hypothetical protein RFI_00240 [Reticulomyxa filosa]|uniref:Uncharacterized protein n=1 Tax=Reticulomyxa filosa TaxID=46433 RepID=X6PGK8_RETFI|nr:hypothetical protein RFI_00240 [Reticulomyxa filosa]|eukprot:ETO36822.1 hypothetical protein RFI_00240 [Reticulomyxa filosa]
MQTQQIGINLSREKQIIQKKEQVKQPKKPKIQTKSENKKEERKNHIQPPRQNTNNQQKKNEQKNVENEEIKQLKNEIAELRQFAIAFQQQQENEEDTNGETSINEYDQ